MNLPPHYRLHPNVSHALQNGKPVVALETAVVTHGLPYPTNQQLAGQMEAAIQANGATPATIGLVEGKICVGLTEDNLRHLSQTPNLRKISRRDFALAIARGESGGTTVAGTMLAAHTAGIRVFATGGIGGVHRFPPHDISADLPELGRTPVIVVCAGAKSILDLPGTLEYLETLGVPVLGYQCDQFPAFYARSSGLTVQQRVETPQEIAAIANAHWALGFGGILVVTPPPAEAALPEAKIEAAITAAIRDAETQHISGQAMTPFLLARVNAITEGKSMQANLALLLNNAQLAAKIAVALAPPPNLI
ncbi:MAG: pseudouridine-5'-phosphate glycosidase [Anaerolineales bacterium]